MDKQEGTIVTLFDFNKAFDSIDIDRLIARTRALFFSDSSITLLESYLRYRQQTVSVNNRFSSWRVMKTGVPHGSILGHLLVYLY